LLVISGNDLFPQYITIEEVAFTWKYPEIDDASNQTVEFPSSAIGGVSDGTYPSVVYFLKDIKFEYLKHLENNTGNEIYFSMLYSLYSDYVLCYLNASSYFWN
jgi:hypothetical protein